METGSVLAVVIVGLIVIGAAALLMTKGQAGVAEAAQRRAAKSG